MLISSACRHQSVSYVGEVFAHCEPGYWMILVEGILSHAVEISIIARIEMRIWTSIHQQSFLDWLFPRNAV